MCKLYRHIGSNIGDDWGTWEHGGNTKIQENISIERTFGYYFVCKPSTMQIKNLLYFMLVKACYSESPVSIGPTPLRLQPSN